MDFLRLAQTRYATKKYDPALRIARDQLEDLKQILRLTPSSINSQPWKFIFIENDQLKSDLAEVSQHNTNKIKEASHLIVFAVQDDLGQFQSYVDNDMNERARAYYNQAREMMGNDQIKEWMARQVYIALGFALSACAAMGIDSTPMEGIDGLAYKKILGLEHHKVLCALAIGYRAKDDQNQPSITPKTRRELDHVVETLA